MTRLIPQAACALLVALVAAWSGCGTDESRVVLREVELLTGEAGRQADLAEMRLVARGKAAILFLETGLWSAGPRGRRRVIRALRKIGDREAAPILAHLARTDADAEVRDAAAVALRELVNE